MLLMACFAYLHLLRIFRIFGGLTAIIAPAAMAEPAIKPATNFIFYHFLSYLIYF